MRRVGLGALEPVADGCKISSGAKRGERHCLLKTEHAQRQRAAKVKST